MRKTAARLWIASASLVVLGATVAISAESAFLKRSDWLKRLGASVDQEVVLRETLDQVSPEDRVEFTQRLLKAVARKPVGPDEKAASFVKAAIACIRGTTGDVRNSTIAEVFATVPVEYLPIVTDELARRFDQEYNNLSDDQYEQVAKAAIERAVDRNASTDEPSVRNAFAIVAFLRGAKDRAGLEPKLLELLPSDQMRELVGSWLRPAVESGNYEAMLAAAAADDLLFRHEIIHKLVGTATIDRLLAKMTMQGGLQVAVDPGLNYFTSPNFQEPTDYGINRLPRRQAIGYQNQSVNICPCPPLLAKPGVYEFHGRK